MPFNLLDDPFFPVVTRSGARGWRVFSDLADTTRDCAVDFDWPRPDFNVAAYEFAIGLATLAFPLLRKGDWTRLWDRPPSPETVRAAMAPLRQAFYLNGEGPRFLQELGGLEGSFKPIEALLIDTPGDSGQDKNADLLTHRDRYEALGLPAAAMALYALQQFAPAGGAGNRTSMRGGGPMTTLVLPGDPDGPRAPLWRTILANLPYGEKNEFDADDLPRIFPWLAPTYASDKAHGEQEINQGDVGKAHALQAFFGMPRRIALRFCDDGACAMTGVRGPRVSGFVQKPWGVNYGLWRHPLTPYRRYKEGEELLSVKPKSARFGYRDWVAVTVGAENKVLAEVALPVASAFQERAEALRRAGGDARLLACGWATEKMTAVAYLAAEQPLHLTADEQKRAALEALALSFAKSADEATTILRFALRNALFAEGAKPSTDAGLFESARGFFYEATEDDFHDALDALLAESAPPDAEQKDKFRRRWLRQMQRAAEQAFARWAPIPLADPERAQRIVEAFKMLSLGLNGYGKLGASLFAVLGLPPREPSKPDKSPTKKGASRGK